MRVYVSVDIEGIAGVTGWQDCSEGRPGYPRAVEYMRGEALAAARGALAAGAEEVVIRDAHGSALNLPAAGWPPGCRLLSGWADRTGYDMVEGIDSTFDALVLVGYHGGAGAEGGILAHTMSSSIVREVRVAGLRANEAVIAALRAGACGVPTACCAGDAACVAEVQAWLPGIATVTTKAGLGFECGLHRRPEDVSAEIERVVGDALAAPVLPPPFHLDGPVDLEMSLTDRRAAEVAAMLPGCAFDHLSATVRTSCADGRAVATTIELWLRLALSTRVP